MIFIFTTLHKKSDAVKIGKALLKQRLIACYNLLSIGSSYWWKGKILDDKETLMILKTKEANFAKIEDDIKKHSGYEVPEIVAIKSTRVSKDYLKWINSETRKSL